MRFGGGDEDVDVDVDGVLVEVGGLSFGLGGLVAAGIGKWALSGGCKW